MQTELEALHQRLKDQTAMTVAWIDEYKKEVYVGNRLSILLAAAISLNLITFSWLALNVLS